VAVYFASAVLTALH